VIAGRDGYVTYLSPQASTTRLSMKEGRWVVQDKGLSEAEEMSLNYYMSSLGLRASSSSLKPAELDVCCKNCGVGVLHAPSQPLSLSTQRAGT
jgi:hypothetical protein